MNLILLLLFSALLVLWIVHISDNIFALSSSFLSTGVTKDFRYLLSFQIVLLKEFSLVFKLRSLTSLVTAVFLAGHSWHKTLCSKSDESSILNL